MPIIVTMLVVTYFNGLFSRLLDTQDDGKTSPTIYLQEDDLSGDELALIYIIGGTLISLTILIALARRFRETFRKIVQVFILLDFFFVFFFGGGLMTLLIIQEIGAPIEWITLALVTWNFSLLGLVAMYHHVPSSVHRFVLVWLNIIMAAMLSSSLSEWIIVFPLLLLVSLADLVSLCFRNLNMGFTPFILPTSFQLLYERPRFLYHVGPIRLRTLDIMLYGMALSLVSYTLTSVFTAIMLLLAALCIIVFIIPYLGKRFRPIPVATLLIILHLLFFDSVLLPFSDILAAKFII